MTCNCECGCQCGKRGVCEMCNDTGRVEITDRVTGDVVHRGPCPICCKPEQPASAIDWGQRRWDAAVALFVRHINHDRYAMGPLDAVRSADALIAAFKGETK